MQSETLNSFQMKRLYAVIKEEHPELANPSGFVFFWESAGLQISSHASTGGSLPGLYSYAHRAQLSLQLCITNYFDIYQIALKLAKPT